MNGKLFRKIQLTEREGTRHGCVFQIQGCGLSAGTADGYPPVPIEGAVSNAPRVEELCVPSSRRRLEHRRVQAQHVDGMARRGSYCAPLVQLVVRTSLLPRRPSNELSCLILIMCRHGARLSLIVPHRMLFLDHYFHSASGCRGVARCLYVAWVWPANGNGRGRSEDAAEASNDRALSVLFAAHALHVLRGARF